MQKLFYGTWAFFGKMLKLSSAVVCRGWGVSVLCNRGTAAVTAPAGGLLQNRPD